MRIIGIIPARYGSTRFPGKPLAEIRGRPMIALVVENARRCRSLAEVVVATDDARIAAVARAAGAETVLTDFLFQSGTDRVAYVAKGRGADVVVNVQGDEPLLPPEAIDALVAPFIVDGGDRLDMATLAAPFHERAEVDNERTAKTVVDDGGNALYFSRAPIPHLYGPVAGAADLSIYLRHIGVYAYRNEFLQRLAATPPARLELAEGLEQLRALAMGARIRVVRVERATIGVDTPEDLRAVEGFLRGREETGAAADAVPKG